MPVSKTHTLSLVCPIWASCLTLSLVPVLPQPVSPMAVLTSPNTIAVSWSAPTGVDCPTIDDYVVVYSDGTGNMTVSSSTSPLMLPNLQHGTTYSLFVAARSEGVLGVSVSTNPPSITTLLAGMYVDCGTVHRYVCGHTLYIHCI